MESARQKRSSLGDEPLTDAVDGLELAAFQARYARGGSRNQPFHPAMMVKVRVYAYASGVFRQLAFRADRNPHTASMPAKLQSEAGQAAYRKRTWIVEPANGWIKNVPGFRQFSLRGLHRVTAEWKLVCMAPNLRRMATLTTR